MAYPESKVGQALGQAGQRLVPRAGLCDQRECRRRPGKVSAGVLDSLCLAGLVLERARGRGSEAAVLAGAHDLLAGCTLRAPAGGRSGEHRVFGAGRRTVSGVGGRQWMDSSSWGEVILSIYNLRRLPRLVSAFAPLSIGRSSLLTIGRSPLPIIWSLTPPTITSISPCLQIILVAARNYSLYNLNALESPRRLSLHAYLTWLMKMGARCLPSFARC